MGDLLRDPVGLIANLVAALILAICLPAHAQAQGSRDLGNNQVNIHIGEAPKQVFAGFGASQPTDQQRLFTRYGPNRVAELADAVYGDLEMNVARLWVHSGANIGVNLMKHRFYNSYVSNAYIDILKRAGVTTLLLATARGEGAPEEPMEEYAEKLASFIRDILDERGVQIHTTGIANEPAGFSAEQLRDAVKHLRRALDERGLSGVAIIAPECASPDACATKAITAMKADQEAWRGLSGVSTHSYNMGANSRVENLILGMGKEYWMTEAGRALSRETDARGKRILVEEEPGDTAEAATTAARFFNDMNHSVTHWIWFIGIGAYDQHPNKDSGQVLARPDDSTGRIKYNTKHHYLKQIRQAFDLGAALHEATSDREKRMNWGFGEKPAITVAAAHNPDGSWGVGVVNTTGLRSSKIARFQSAMKWLVQIQLPSAAARKKYRVTRSHAHGSQSEGTVSPDTQGVLRVEVGAHELVTFRSQ